MNQEQTEIVRLLREKQKRYYAFTDELVAARRHAAAQLEAARTADEAIWEAVIDVRRALLRELDAEYAARIAAVEQARLLPDGYGDGAVIQP